MPEENPEYSDSSDRGKSMSHESKNKEDRAELLKESHYSHNRQQTQKRHKAIIVMVVLLLLIGGSWRGYMYNQHRQLINQIPSSFREIVNFPIYIPADTDLKIQRESISYSGGNLIFTIGANENKLVVTEQAKPATFDINKFAGITEPIPIVSRLGTGVRGKVANRNIVIFSTDKTLISCVSLSNIAPEKMDAAVTSLVRID